MTALYGAYSGGEETPLEELPIQYADYAAWQRSWLKGEVLEEQAEYWRRELEGVRGLEMPVDSKMSEETTARSGWVGFRLGKESSARLKELSRGEEATIFMTLMAGFQGLLYRYSGQEDFAVGTPIAGRNEVETEGLIGFFVNTLVVGAVVGGRPSFREVGRRMGGKRGAAIAGRKEVEAEGLIGFFVNTLVVGSVVGGRPSFREVVRRMREKMLGAYGHQDLPFERLVDGLEVERNVRRTPLFQAVLAFQNEGLGRGLKLGGGMRIEPVEAGEGEGMGISAKFELLL